jgi:hypothetical protein
MIRVPEKPFDDFKWRWAVLTPTESLNKPPIFHGVLRKLLSLEGVAPSSTEFHDAMRELETEISGQMNLTLDLARSPERNLIRNSGQYWKALGLTNENRGQIALSDLGRRVAEGDLSLQEFACQAIETLELPNRRIQSDAEVVQWQEAGLSFRPLSLLLKVLSGLKDHGEADAYITKDELRRVVIPLSGVNAPLEEYVASIIHYRHSPQDFSTYPNCTPSSNDARMAGEFLLFLSHYGFCEHIDERFKLEQGTYFISENEANHHLNNEDLLREAPRTYTTLRRISRLGQSEFRREVLSNFNHSCVITGETLPIVLEAAHIIPVEDNGSDVPGNGLCLRSDIHKLFDNGYFRIKPTGHIVKSLRITNSPTYSCVFPTSIVLPNFIDPRAISWRYNHR